MRKLAVVAALLCVGCLSEGRKVSQASIEGFAQRIEKKYDEIAVISRTQPVTPDVARVVESIADDAAQIRKWTDITKVDFGRVEDPVPLDAESQAEARADYTRETETRDRIKRAAAAAGLPIEPPPEEEEAPTDIFGLVQMIAGPGIAGVLGGLYKRQRKRTQAAEEKARREEEAKERKAAAVREAIHVIGQSSDTTIRKTAAIKPHLVREFAEEKAREYEDRIESLENGGGLVSQLARAAEESSS
jgi:hypothetical protein